MSEMFVLRPRPPVRALAISAIGAVAAAILIVVARAADLHAVLLVIGIVLLALSLLLAVSALALARRLRSEVALDETGYQVSQAGGSVRGRWADVVRVVTIDNGLLLLDDDDAETGHRVLAPRGVSDPSCLALMDSITRRLDTNRGYKPLN